MKTKIEQVLERCLKGREVAVWGNPSRLLLRALKNYRFHIADAVDVAKHFVVAVDDDDLVDFLQDGQSKAFNYVDDYICFKDIGGEIPFEWECFGAKIGRQTYFGEGIAGGCENGYIKSIGHFTSINSTVDMGVNHQLDMVFTSDDIELFFSDENKELFHKRLDDNPKKPYARKKGPMTIGSDVYIGAYAFINASTVTSIGDGAIIGSNAVVIEDVPPYAVVVGVPGKIKKYRFSEKQIEILMRVKWWDWDDRTIARNADCFKNLNLFFERFG